MLKGRRHGFVLVGPNVRRIVSRADLNKPPVPVYLFGLISLLEMHLGFWIRDGYGEEGWQKKPTDGRLTAAKNLQTEWLKRTPT